METFDKTLEEIFEHGTLPLMSLMEDLTEILGDEIREKLSTPLPIPVVQITYLIDRKETLPKETVTYHHQIRDLRGLLSAVGTFYERLLTPGQLARLRVTDPNNDVNFLDDDKLIYDALNGSDGCRTDLLSLDGSNGEYEVELDWSC